VTDRFWFCVTLTDRKFLLQKSLIDRFWLCVTLTDRKFLLQKSLIDRFWFCVTFDRSYNCSLKLRSVNCTGLLFKLVFNPLPYGVEHVQFLL
jgi:hypothetical protein